MKTTYKKLKRAQAKALRKKARQGVKRGVESPSLVWKRIKVLN